MNSVRIESAHGGTLIPAERITAIEVVGGTLVAHVPSMGGGFVLAEGDPHELSDAARALMPGITGLGEGDHVVRAARSSTGIGWDVTTHDESGEESGGGGWAAVSSSQPGLKPRRDH
ncbi:hypothetical protein [Streptomyces sp. NPDC049040]|uniref:hypothetical protein n=1 Tax=Streptomyces sp. NPDC049040 TaxID=3365593 RepID=UPI0037110ADF